MHLILFAAADFVLLNCSNQLLILVIFLAERVAELESTVKDLEVQLSEQEEEASSAIKKWQESCMALEEKNSELLQALEGAGEGVEGNGDDAVEAMKAKLQETESELENARAKLLDDDDVVTAWERKFCFKVELFCFFPLVLLLT